MNRYFITHQLPVAARKTGVGVVLIICLPFAILGAAGAAGCAVLALLCGLILSRR